MPSDRLTPTETAIVLTLMAEARWVSNAELKERYGFTLVGAARRKLVELKLVQSRREHGGRAYEHELTDRGWAWCRDELTTPRPRTGGTVVGGLYAVLAGLHRHLTRDRLALADVFRAGSEPSPPDPADPADPADPVEGVEAVDSADPAVMSVSRELVEDRIRTAYAALARRPGAWVKLARLRPKLAGLPSAEVDEVLRALDREPRVHVIPEEDQKTLTARDRAAAVRIGGQDNHLLAIEDA